MFTGGIARVIRGTYQLICSKCVQVDGEKLLLEALDRK